MHHMTHFANADQVERSPSVGEVSNGALQSKHTEGLGGLDLFFGEFSRDPMASQCFGGLDTSRHFALRRFTNWGYMPISCAF